MNLGRRILATAIATYDGNLRLCSFNGKVQDFGDFLHVGTWTVQTRQALLVGGSLNASLGEVVTACKTAATTVGAGEMRLDFLNQGIFLHLEFLGDEEQNDRQDASEDS